MEYKVVILGDSGVGKTAIINMKLSKIFDVETPPTVGSLTYRLVVNVDGRVVHLSIWDTAGQERYMSLTSAFLRNTAVAILVADISNPESIDHIDAWANTLDACQIKPQIIVALNKSDLAIHKQTLIRDAREKLIRKYENIMIVSALTGTGISELFDVAAKLAASTENSYEATITKNPQKSKGCC
jgi:small GTP-binding protein